MDVQVVQCDGRGHVDPSVSALAVSVVGTYVFDTVEGTVDPSLSDAENAAWMLTKIVANNDLRGRKTVGFMDRGSRVLNAYPSVILRIEDVPVGKKLSKHCPSPRCGSTSPRIRNSSCISRIGATRMRLAWGGWRCTVCWERHLSHSCERVSV